MRALVLVYAIASLFLYDPMVGDNPGASGIASAKVRAAHYYHGGPHGVRSIEDWTGEYFYRDGNRCRLFTKGFETKWRAK